MDDVKLLSVPEAAEKLGVHRTTLLRWKTEHKIPHVMIGDRVYFRATDIEEFVSSRVVDSENEEA